MSPHNFLTRHETPVNDLVTRFTALMDDPLLPELLREFRDALVIEQADRARIADELVGKARTS